MTLVLMLHVTITNVIILMMGTSHYWNLKLPDLDVAAQNMNLRYI